MKKRNTNQMSEDRKKKFNFYLTYLEQMEECHINYIRYQTQYLTL